MPCPHCKITIIKRSNNESAVSAAAYQSGEKLFSEYDQEQKHYPYKNEVTHKEIMLPPHVPPEYADRNTLWNSAEAQEKQWNSQLARRFVLAIPREIPPGQYADLIRDYCREFFVSKGLVIFREQLLAALVGGGRNSGFIVAPLDDGDFTVRAWQVCCSRPMCRQSMPTLSVTTAGSFLFPKA